MVQRKCEFWSHIAVKMLSKSVEKHLHFVMIFSEGYIIDDHYFMDDLVVQRKCEFWSCKAVKNAL